MNITIAGSRDYPNEEQVRKYLGSLLRPGIPASYQIITGEARGVDTWAHHQAKQEGARTLIIKANWDLHGKRAGYLRNVKLVAAADIVVVFWDGESKGSKHTIDEALRQHKPLEVYFPLV